MFWLLNVVEWGPLSGAERVMTMGRRPAARPGWVNRLRNRRDA